VLLPLPLTGVALLAGRLPAFANGSSQKTHAYTESSALIDVSHSRGPQTHTSIRRAMLGRGEVAEEEEEVSATHRRIPTSDLDKTRAHAPREATRILDRRMPVRDQRGLNRV